MVVVVAEVAVAAVEDEETWAPQLPAVHRTRTQEPEDVHLDGAEVELLIRITVTILRLLTGTLQEHRTLTPTEGRLLPGMFHHGHQTRMRMAAKRRRGKFHPGRRIHILEAEHGVVVVVVAVVTPGLEIGEIPRQVDRQSLRTIGEDRMVG